MERVLTVEFGPSRSKRFRKAVEEAQSGAGECSELGSGSYRVRFLLGCDGRVYTSLARLLQRVRDWRATEVFEGDRLVSAYHAGDIRVSGCPTVPNRPDSSGLWQQADRASPPPPKPNGRRALEDLPALLVVVERRLSHRNGE